MDSHPDVAQAVDLAALARESAGGGLSWSYREQDADLNVNLLVWDAGEGVVEHVNREVDVLLVGVAGAGVVEVDGLARDLRAGQVIVIPKGSCRAIRAVGGRFAYLTCHRRRAGLWPRRGAREG